MELYCTEEFKHEVARLRKNSSYATIEETIAKGYCGVAFSDACGGDPLSDWPDLMTYRKRRLEGSGGYRVYTLAVFAGERAYLGFIHPKTGKYKQDNLSKDEINSILRQILEARKSGNLYIVEAEGEKKKKLNFIPLTAPVPVAAKKPQP
jgi:hypothetical protein